MSPERTEAQPALNLNNGKPGAILAREREAQGLSIDQVADQLKLAPRQIIALERDDFASLPGMAIVRGFVRAYAKHLKLDAAPLVAMIAVESGLGESSAMRREMATPFSETRMPSMSRRNMTPLWVGGSALVLFLIVAMVVMQWTGKWPASLSNLSKVDVASASASASATSSASVSSPAEAGTSVVTPVTSSSDSANPTAVPNSTAPAVNAPVANTPDASALVNHQPNATPVVTAPTSTPTPTPVTTPAPLPTTIPTPKPATNLPTNAPIAANAPVPNANNVLVLRLKQDSWVEVRRQNGPVLISRVLKAGSSETIDMTSPVQLVVGNVNGVEANLRGSNFNLKMGSGNTARLMVK